MSLHFHLFICNVGRVMFTFFSAGLFWYPDEEQEDVRSCWKPKEGWLLLLGLPLFGIEHFHRFSLEVNPAKHCHGKPRRTITSPWYFFLKLLFGDGLEDLRFLGQLQLPPLKKISHVLKNTALSILTKLRFIHVHTYYSDMGFSR